MKPTAYFEIPADVAKDPLALDCRIAVRLLALKKMDKAKDPAGWAVVNEEIAILELLLDRLKKQIKRKAKKRSRAVGYNKPIAKKAKALKAKRTKKPIPSYVRIPQRRRDPDEL